MPSGFGNPISRTPAAIKHHFKIQAIPSIADVLKFGGVKYKYRYTIRLHRTTLLSSNFYATREKAIQAGVRFAQHFIDG